MKSIHFAILLCLIIFSNQSCTSVSENEIEEELLVHFENFVEEAAINGLEISLAEIDISAYVENIESRGTLGQCKSYSDGSKQVVIDQQFWNRSSDIEREYIVFHELGHCILGRDHDDSKDESGQCISIMQSGDNTCNGTYTNQNRNSLLNELFNF